MAAWSLALAMDATAALGTEPFTFTVTADSHLDENTDRDLYARTLANAAADKPVFHVDLGDTFMSGKHASREAAARQYAEQRRFFDLLGAPVHLVLGNHDGESGRYLDGTTNNLAAWSRAMRMRFFPEPLAPDGRGYYAWLWPWSATAAARGPDLALFVVLDPYWFTPSPRRSRDEWYRTLGSEQYAWLKRTLEESRAPFRFVFIHQLVGGLDRAGRGGAEAAPFCEWGGRNPDGTDGFAQHRPGWPMPIHALLVSNRVTAVFHGHDHLYAKQELDGIVYQAVPQPGDPRGSLRSAAEYGYKNGVLLGSPGHLRVKVSPGGAAVDYVRTDRSVAHAFVLKPTFSP